MVLEKTLSDSEDFGNVQKTRNAPLGVSTLTLRKGREKSLGTLDLEYHGIRKVTFTKRAWLAVTIARDCCIEIISHYPVLSWRCVYHCIDMIIYLLLQIESSRGGLVYVHDADTYPAVRIDL